MTHGAPLLTCILHRDCDLPRVEGGVPHGWHKLHLVRPRYEKGDGNPSELDRVHRASVRAVVLVVRTVDREDHFVRQAGEHGIAEKYERDREGRAIGEMRKFGLGRLDTFPSQACLILETPQVKPA